MNCGEYRKMLSRQIDRELDHEQAQEFQEHLAECSECRSFEERVGLLNRGLQVIGTATPPNDLVQRVKERVARERGRRLDLGILPAWARVPLAIMIALTAIGLGNAAGRSISSMFSLDTTDSGVEYVLASETPSFADVLTENGTGENDQ